MAFQDLAEQKQYCVLADSRSISTPSLRPPRVWVLDSGECAHVFQGHNKSVECVCVSADGRVVASGSREKEVVRSVHPREQPRASL
eukprot:1157725-Pelagomonas_calceolata.AAC.12